MTLKRHDVTDSDVSNDVLYAGSHDGTPNNILQSKIVFNRLATGRLKGGDEKDA